MRIKLYNKLPNHSKTGKELVFLFQQGSKNLYLRTYISYSWEIYVL